MANDTPLDYLDIDIVKRVDALLEDTDKMQLKTAVSLTLQMVSKNYQATNQLIEHVKETNGQVGKLKADVEELKKKNIINWVNQHQRLAFIYAGVFVLVVDILVDKFSSAEGMQLLVLMFRKWLGI